MKTIILILSLIFTPLAFGQSCNDVQVITGYGYLTNAQSQITAYTSYPLGSVCIPLGFTYTEVPDQTTLNKTTLYIPPPPAPTPQQQLDALRAAQLKTISDTALSTSASATTVSALKTQGAQ